MPEKLKELPEKLIRMRDAAAALTAEYRAVQERYLRVMDERRKQYHAVEQLKSKGLDYPREESKKFRDKEVAEAKEVLAKIDKALAELQEKKDAITAKRDPLKRTVRACEKHIGIDSDDNWIRGDQHRVTY